MHIVEDWNIADEDIKDLENHLEDGIHHALSAEQKSVESLKETFETNRAVFFNYVDDRIGTHEQEKDRLEALKAKFDMRVTEELGKFETSKQDS